MRAAMRWWMAAWLWIAAGAAATPASAGQAPAPFREVEVCFVLDTTGSMSNLIKAAREKIWFIANEIVSAPSKPAVTLCLLGFRDREDAYVTRHTKLTPDIDRIYAELAQFQAEGGGDTPEAVNQALAEAIDASGWSQRDAVLKLIFLVGDAPPKVYAGEPQYPELAARAAARGIVINPVLCGEDDETRRTWDAIAKLAHGRGAAIGDATRVERIVTPMDQDLAALNQRIGRTLVPYGSEAVRAETEAKQQSAEAMDDIGVSDRLAYNAATGRTVQGGGDLIDALDRNELATGASDRARRPEGLRSMTEAELLAALQARRDERAALRRVVDALIAERRDYIESRRKSGPQGFDAAVAETIRLQLDPP